MKFKVWSDLHLEGRWFHYKEKEEDKDTVLILAGDIGTIKSGLIPFLIEMCLYFKDVIMITGNHEYYHGLKEVVENQLDELHLDTDNFHRLDNTGVIIEEGIRVLGTPLWTSLTPQQQNTVENAIMDYRLTELWDSTFQKYRKITPADHNYLYQQAYLWLRHELDKEFDGKTIVLTHWSPTHKLTLPKFAGSPNNPYFCNDVEHLMHTYDIDTWIYGHTHGKVFIDYNEDERFNGTRMINNPRGYSELEVPTFEPDRVFEV